MLILAGTALSLLLVPVLGGRLSGLAHLALRSRWVVVYALALQVVAISVVPHWPRSVLVGLVASSYLLAAVFVWLNRAVRGLPLLAVGAGLNAGVMALNGGQMPASPAALRAAGITQDGDQYVNSGALAEPVLPWLGDAFASPGWLPLQNVYSVGDLLVLAGAVWVVHSACGSRLPQLRQPRRVMTTASSPLGW